ncbi:MAG: mannose-1-phosphate guanylyltransferase [Deltaproteobacteria bacterium]|nr:mannose-1-phosphate guanylyltransferase [Deltaproteobacteria bacterium]
MADAGAHVVIMAGGSGTRFWPKSRAAHPKQFLKLGGPVSLLRQTAERVLPLVGWERLVVVTAAVHAEHAARDLPELPARNLLIEPVGRNTAPCIGWATRTILARDPTARLAVLPADHFIADAAGFRAHLEAALGAARDRIVLLGLVPTRPETGYGYIQRGADARSEGEWRFHEVARFVEKPDRATAERYLLSGDFLWNSGMFVFPAAVMDTAIRALLPDLARGLDRLEQAPPALGEIYPTLPAISIDYGVMEKAEGVLVLPSRFPWSDVGSWDAVHEIEAKDADDNVLRGDALALGVKRSLIEAAAGRLVAAIDVEDLIIVDTPDALLVAPRGRSQEVKRAVDALAKRGRKDLL